MKDMAFRDKLLLISTEWNFSPLAKFLLRNNGIDVNVRNEEHSTPLMLTVGQENSKLAAELIAKGADVNASNRWGMTALTTAVFSDSPTLVSLLLERGALIDKQIAKEGYEGFTALMISIKLSTHEQTKLLLAYGADMEIENTDGDTALMLAIRCKHKLSVEALLEKGAAIDHANKAQETAWTLADDQDEIKAVLTRYSKEKRPPYYCQA